MKLLSLFLLFSVLAFANDRQQQQDFIASLKADEIEQHILDSDVYKGCYQNFQDVSDPKTQKSQIKDCVEAEIKKASAEDLEKLQGNLGIKDLKLSEAKTTNSLKKYLEERIHDAIHGKGSSANKKLKEMKYVDQKVYFELYRQQLRRNITVEIAKYCLENVGIKDNPGYFINIVPAPFDDNDKISFKTINYDAVDISDLDDIKEKDFSSSKTAKNNFTFLKNGSSDKYEDKIYEYNFCDRLSTDATDPCFYKKARNTKIISKLKDFEFKLANEIGDSKVLGARFHYCKSHILKNNCEVFRCNNSYDWSKLNTDTEVGKSLKYCKDFLGIDKSTTNTSTSANSSDDLENVEINNSQGNIACNVIAKLDEYGKTIAEVERLLNELKENFDVKSGIRIGTTFKGEYNKGAGDDEKGLDSITAISSKELVTKVDQFDKNKNDIENCKDPDTGQINTTDPNCTKFLNEEDIGNIRNAAIQAEAETQAYLKRIDELKDKDDEDIKTFLRKHGLDKYVDQVGSMDDDELISLIKTKYKSDRQAVISSMNDKLHDIINKEDKDEIIQEVASDKISEIDNKKERIETLFNYSNMVTSYLGGTRLDQQGNPIEDSKFDTSYIRNIEEQGFDEFAADEKSQYQVFFDDVSADGTESASESDTLSTEKLLDGLGDFATAD